MGSQRVRDEHGLGAGSLAGIADRLRVDRRSVSWLVEVTSGQTRVLGVLGSGDTIKPSAKAAVAALHSMRPRVAMLTGDNVGSARVAGATFRRGLPAVSS